MAVSSWPLRVRSSGHGEMWPAVLRTLLRCVCRTTGRKPRKAATARNPIAPTAADGEPSARARGTTATAATVAPVVMVTVYSAGHQRGAVGKMLADE